MQNAFPVVGCEERRKAPSTWSTPREESQPSASTWGSDLHGREAESHAHSPEVSGTHTTHGPHRQTVAAGGAEPRQGRHLLWGVMWISRLHLLYCFVSASS